MFLVPETNRIDVAAHPDDEVLGCGGAIASHADAGDQVQVIVSEGATSRQPQRDRIQAGEELWLGPSGKDGWIDSWGSRC